MTNVILVGIGFTSLVLCCTLVASGPAQEILFAGLDRGTIGTGLGMLSLLAWGLFLFSK